MLQNTTKDDWFTAHPNGKEHKGRHIFAEEGESKADAIERKYPKKNNVQEKRQNLINNQKSYAESFNENKKLRIKTDNLGGYKEIDLSESGVNEEYFKKNKKYPEVLIKGGQMAKNPFYNAEKAVKKQEKKEQLQEKIKNFKPNTYQQAELNAIKENPNQAFINRQKGYKPYKYDSKDTMQATDEKQIDYNDFWYIKDNPLSKVGVFPYYGKNISDELEPNKIYYVLRPEEELSKEETLESFKLVPIIDDHTMLGNKEGMQPAEEKGVHGTIGSDTYYKDGVVYGDLKIFSETLKDEIENGKKELSMGYFCDYELADGEYNEQPYQAIQRNIKANHVALVQEGRMGADVRVMDCKFTFDNMEIRHMENTEEKTKVENQDQCKDEDVDKRALIDEVGGILKDKVDEELWKTIIGKIEKLAYNDSEAANNDEDVIEEKKDELKDEVVKDEEIVVPPVEEIKEDDEDKKTDVTVAVSMDEMIKAIAERDALVDEIKTVIGDNANYKSMTADAVAKYACDKLDIKVAKGMEKAALMGYLKANAKNKVTYTLDNAINAAPKTDAAFEAYKKGV